MSLDPILNDLREECKESLISLCALLGFTDVNLRTHGKLLDVLESNSQRKLIIMPRGSLKSTISCVAYPIWRLLRDPNERILIDSQLYTNSKNFIREIRGHLESARLRMIFGDWRSDTWNESELIIKPRTRPYKEPSITAGGIGTVRVGQHYSICIGDDYSSWDNSNSADKAEKVYSHYKYNLSILEPGGTYVIIGTRYSDRDLYSKLFANEECRFL